MIFRLGQVEVSKIIIFAFYALSVLSLDKSMESHGKNIFKFLLLTLMEVWVYFRSFFHRQCKEIDQSDVVFIAGACGTIGSELLHRLSVKSIQFYQKIECSFILIDKDEKSLLKAVDYIRNTTKNKVHYLAEDLTNYHKIQDYIDHLVDENIIPTIFIFNAAINEQLTASKISPQQFNSFSNVAGEGAYCASKAALFSYLSTVELENQDITFSAICPTKIEGKFFEHIKYANIPTYLIAEYSAKEVVDTVLYAIRNKSKTIIMPFYFRILLYFMIN
ncbi:hypothetical protein MXB_2510 [Myxobolus squamalis]|nr:hypothetical protein MXB_2510 [Myxobolus squamalis]